MCGHLPRGSTAQSRHGTACSKKTYDESCGLGTARWTCDESGGSEHICQRPWMQTRHVRQDRLTTVSDRARWRAKLEESWNVLTTWPVQSVLTEASFLCAREVKKGILTNCADTARLVGRSRCCQSPISQRSVQSSIANLFVSHEMCLWSIQFRKTLCTAAILPTSKRRQPFRQKRTMRFASGEKKSLCKRDVQSVGFTPTVATLRIRRSQR